MRNEENTCKNCDYYNAEQEECRTNPPIVFVGANDEVYSAYPETTPEDWCGCHSKGL